MTDLEFLEARLISIENELRRMKKNMRDDFASAALTGMCAHGWQPFDLMTEKCYQVADLMIAERAK